MFVHRRFNRGGFTSCFGWLGGKGERKEAEGAVKEREEAREGARSAWGKRKGREREEEGAGRRRKGVFWLSKPLFFRSRAEKKSVQNS